MKYSVLSCVTKTNKIRDFGKWLVLFAVVIIFYFMVNSELPTLNLSVKEFFCCGALVYLLKWADGFREKNEEWR